MLQTQILHTFTSSDLSNQKSRNNPRQSALLCNGGSQPKRLDLHQKSLKSFLTARACSAQTFDSSFKGRPSTNNSVCINSKPSDFIFKDGECREVTFFRLLWWWFSLCTVYHLRKYQPLWVWPWQTLVQQRTYRLFTQEVCSSKDY